MDLIYSGASEKEIEYLYSHVKFTCPVKNVLERTTSTDNNIGTERDIDSDPFKLHSILLIVCFILVPKSENFSLLQVIPCLKYCHL